MYLSKKQYGSTNDLKLKRISLGINIHNNPKVNTAWLDDVALSTGYIGTMETSGLRDGQAGHSGKIRAITVQDRVRFAITLTKPERYNL